MSRSSELFAPYHPRRPEITTTGTFVVVPDEPLGAMLGAYLSEKLLDGTGLRPSIIAASAMPANAWQTHDLIVVGNMMNCLAARRLYIHHHIFADAYYPGDDGYDVRTVADPFGTGRGCYLVAGSTEAGLWRAADIFLRLIQEHGPAPGRLLATSSLHTNLPVPTADDLRRAEQECHAAFLVGTGVGSIHRCLDAGLVYGLTGRPEYGQLFRTILFDYIALAQQHGTFAFEHMLFIYSWLWRLVRVWDLVEDAPIFDDADRLTVGNCLLELGRYLRTLPYWPEEANPPGEPRQNHSTFAALSLAAVRTYLFKAYRVTELDALLPAADQIMNGQAISTKANDDAGVGYAWLVPRHTIDYLLLQDNWDYLTRGRLRALANLAVMTTDNRRDESTYGDVGAYIPWQDLPRPASLKLLALAAWYYQDGGYAWAYQWLGEGKDFERAYSIDRFRSWADFYDGVFDGHVAPTYPDDFRGVRVALLDEAAVDWVRHRARELGWQSRPQTAYVDKISFRRDFDPQSEYLCLEGPSTYAHGHQDGNAITRLTWRDRLWLADLDYIRFQARFHNSLVIVRGGEDRGVPPLTALDCLANLPSAGITVTSIADYNGADWRRRIVWLPDRFFMIFDDVEARQLGDYVTQCHWRLLGDVHVAEQTLQAHQGGEAFAIVSSDPSRLSLSSEDSRRSHWQAYPHASGGVTVLRQEKRGILAVGEHLSYVNLLTAWDAEETLPFRLETIDESLVRVVGDGTSTLVGVPTRAVRGVRVVAEAMVVRSDFLVVAGCTAISGNRDYFTSDVPVSLEINLDRADVILLVDRPATVQLRGIGIEGNSAEGWKPRILQAGRHHFRLSDVPDWEMLLHRIGSAETEPHPTAPLVEPMFQSDIPTFQCGREVDVGALITVVQVEPDQSLLVGTSEGTLVHYPATGDEEWRAELGGAIRCVQPVDVDRDGRREYAIGTDAAELLLLAPDGRVIWRQSFEPTHGRPQMVAAIAIADLDGNENSAILAATEGWRLHAFEASGRARWHSWIKYHAATACIAADVDEDGRNEVVVGNEYHTPINCFGPDGTFRWFTWEQVGSEARATTPRSGTHVTALLLFDVNADGRPEILYGTADNWVYAVQSLNGQILWQTNVGSEVVALVATQRADTPFAVATALGDLIGIDLNGGKRWRYAGGVGATGVVSVARGTKPSILVLGCQDGGVIAFDEAGGIIGRWQVDGWVSRLAVAPGQPQSLWAATGTRLHELILPKN